MSGNMTMLAEIDTLDQWPVVMAWSKWESSAQGDGTTGEIDNAMPDFTCKYWSDTYIPEAQRATLAVAGASGPVQLLSVSVTLDGAVNCTPDEAISSSPKAVTALQWLEDGSLAIGRLNEVALARREEMGHFRVPMEEHRGWTSMATPIDYVELPMSQSFIAAMTDGTLRLIGKEEDTAPIRLSTLQEHKSAEEGSLSLCESLQSSFMALEKAGNKSKNKAPIPTTAAMRLSGFSQLDTMGTVFIAYERYQLDRRIYVMANLRKINFAIARFHNAKLDQHVIQATKTALSEAAGLGKRGDL